MSKKQKNSNTRIFMVFMIFHGFHGCSYFWQKVLQHRSKSSLDGWARPEKYRLITSGGKTVVCDVIFVSADIVRAGQVTFFSWVRPRPGLANCFWLKYQKSRKSWFFNNNRSFLKFVLAVCGVDVKTSRYLAFCRCARSVHVLTGPRGAEMR